MYTIIPHMTKNNLHEPISKQDLGEFTESVILPSVENIVQKTVRTESVQLKSDLSQLVEVVKRLDLNNNEIIDILDKQGKILEALRAENASHVASYKSHDNQIEGSGGRLIIVV